MKKLLLIACITGTTFSSISQLNWQKGGNSVAGGANSSLGTNATWNAPLLFQTFGVNRMVLQGGGTGNNDGRMALGNNLVGAFTPANRLHLHQTGGDFGIQFTNNTTGNSASNGFVMDLLDNGRFQFSQYQNQDVRFQMPNSLLMQLIG